MKIVAYSPILKPRKGYPFRVFVRVKHPGVRNTIWVTGSHHRTRAAAEKELSAYRSSDSFISGEIIESDAILKAE